MYTRSAWTHVFCTPLEYPIVLWAQDMFYCKYAFLCACQGFKVCRHSLRSCVCVYLCVRTRFASVYVCVCLCVPIRFALVCLCIFVRTYSFRVCVYVCVCVYSCAHTRFARVCGCLSAFVCMHSLRSCV